MRDTRSRVLDGRTRFTAERMRLIAVDHRLEASRSTGASVHAANDADCAPVLGLGCTRGTAGSERPVAKGEATRHHAGTIVAEDLELEEAPVACAQRVDVRVAREKMSDEAV